MTGLFLSLCGLTLVLSGTTLYLLFRLRRTLTGSAALLADFANSLSPAIVDLQQHVGQIETALDELPQRVKSLMEEANRGLMETGAFLVDDEAAARIEREIHASQDHFVSANGAQRYSPLHSSPLVEKSRAGTSRPVPRRSGNR